MKKRYLILIVMVIMFLIPCLVYGSEPDTATTDSEDTKTTISGNIIISYSPGSGRFSVEYSGTSSISKGSTYTWFKGGSSVSNTEDYKPTSTGTYYCTLENDNYTGELTSGEITLYQAKGKKDMTFSNEYGLYPKGASVTGSVKLEKGETVTGWSTSVKGVAVPSSGNPITFTMPAQDITVTPTISKTFSIKISGGTADKYVAMPGDVITIRANKIKNETFSNWKISGGKLADANSKTTTFTMPSSDVTIEVEYKSDKEDDNKKTSSSTTSSSSTRTADNPASPSVLKADANNAVYEILNDGGYKIDIRHASQGPLCERAFRAAQGRDYLVTDYFNIVINESYGIYELPSPIRIKLNIPSDLQKSGRYWRMVCISRGGVPYSFPDEDRDDSTITFSPDRFYAYAMVFNDEGFSAVSEPETVPTEVAEEEPEPEQPLETSSSHNIDESQTITSTTHSVDESQTYAGEDDSVTTSSQPGTLNMDSDKKFAITMAHGTRIPTFQI